MLIFALAYSHFAFSSNLFHGHIVQKGINQMSPPENKLDNVNFCPSLEGQKVFVRFLGELKKPKSPFEIN